MTSTVKNWLHNLVAATITGGATALLSALGVAAADGVGLKVASFDLKQLGILTASGAVVGLAAYLKTKPLPETNEETKQ